MIRRIAVVALVVSFCATGFAEEPKSKWPGIHELVSKLQDAVEKGDGDRFVGLLDIDSMVHEILEGTDFAKNEPQARAGFKSGFTKSLKASASRHTLIYPFVSFEVRRVTNIGPNRVDAYVRLTDSDGDRQKMHLYLTAHGAGWRIYDLMDADGGLRVSVLGRVAVMQMMREGMKIPWIKRVGEYRSAMSLMLEGEAASAAELLEGLATAGLPKDLEAQRLVMLGACRRVLEEPERALQLIDRALALDGSMPIAHYARAGTANDLGMYADALKHANRYGDLLDIDAEILYEKGRAQWGLGQKEQALKSWRDGLVDHPASLEVLEMLLLHLPANEKVSLARNLLALHNWASSMSELGESALDAEDVSALKVIVQGYGAKEPEHPDRDYYEGHVLRLSGDHKSAALSFEAGWKKHQGADADEDEREAFLYWLVEEKTQAGDPVGAWRVSPDPTAALTQVTDLLFDAKDLDAVQKVLDVATSAGADTRARVQAALYMRRDQFAKAKLILEPVVARLHEQAPAKYLSEYEDAWPDWSAMWALESELFLAYWKLGMKQPAQALATRVLTRDKDTRFEIVMLVKAGNADAAVTLAAPAVDDGYDLTELLTNELIEKELAQPKFEALRKLIASSGD